MARATALFVTIYQSKDGWRWRLKARNGRIVADSGEAYTSQANANRAALRLSLASIEFVPGMERSVQHGKRTKKPRDAR